MTSKSKSHQIYLEICTQDIWKKLNIDLKKTSYNFLLKNVTSHWIYLKVYTRANLYAYTQAKVLNTNLT